MLAYAHISLLKMLSRFTPDDHRYHLRPEIRAKEACRGKGFHTHETKCDDVPCLLGRSTFPRSPQPNGVIRTRSSTCPWKMQPTSPSLIVCKANTKKDLSPSTAQRHDKPLSRHRLSYLSGGLGSGKTTRAIELFRQRDPLVFTPTHHLAKEMRARGVQAQTYHSFFRWSGQTEWTPERMGQKFM